MPLAGLLLLLALARAAEVPLSRNGSAAWTANATVGGGAPLALLVDTGSGDVAAAQLGPAAEPLPGAAPADVALSVDGGRVVLADAAPYNATVSLLPAADVVALQYDRLDAHAATAALTFARADGVLGLGYPGASLWGAQSLAGRLAPAFELAELDLAAGALRLGADAQTDGVEWGEAQASAAPSHHLLRAFDLRLCGAPLFANWSSSWEAVVDTGSACLTLPGDFFDAAVAWLAPAGGCDDDFCYVGLGSPLPELSFALREGGGVARVVVPLSDLLLSGDGDGDLSALCLRRGYDVRDAARPFMPSRNRIVLGAMALQSTRVVLDFAGGRVGLSTSDADDDSACPAPAECVGDQQYNQVFNRCDEPDCERYAMRALDEDSHTCVRSRWYVALWTVMVAFAIAEVGLYVARERIAGAALAGSRHEE